MYHARRDGCGQEICDTFRPRDLSGRFGRGIGQPQMPSHACADVRLRRHYRDAPLSGSAPTAQGFAVGGAAAARRSGARQSRRDFQNTGRSGTGTGAVALGGVVRTVEVRDRAERGSSGGQGWAFGRSAGVGPRAVAASARGCPDAATGTAPVGARRSGCGSNGSRNRGVGLVRLGGSNSRALRLPAVVERAGGDDPFR